MEIKNLLSTTIAGLVSGAALALMMQYRDEAIDEPSTLEKVKSWESKIFHDGEDQALLLAKVKQDAKLAAQQNTATN